jgi:pimeloyl-ACP methyl ester carboxylesterase
MDRFVTTNGIRLHYLDYPGDGPTIVLAPGLAANAHFYGSLISHLVPRLHVIAVDLRGRGDSDKPESGYSMEEHAADILGMLDTLEIDQVVMSGHSFGGLLTYYLAANHPDRVSQAIPIDAPAEVDQEIVAQMQPTFDRLNATFPEWEGYLEQVKTMPFFQDWDWDPALEVFYREDLEELPDGRLRSKCRADHIRQALEGTLEIDWPGVAGRVTQPTLLIRATDPLIAGSAPILPADRAEATLALLADGRLIQVPGTHLTFLFGSSAELVAAAIIDFVEGEVSATGS